MTRSSRVVEFGLERGGRACDRGTRGRRSGGLPSHLRRPSLVPFLPTKFSHAATMALFAVALFCRGGGGGGAARGYVEAAGSLTRYDDLLSSDLPRERIKNLDVFRLGDGENETLAICNLAILLPFSYRFSWFKADAPNRFSGYAKQFFAVSSLAVQDFNDGVGDVVPALKGINETCKVRLVPEFFDTENKAVTATEHLIVASLGLQGSNGIVPHKPCAVIGSVGSPFGADNNALGTTSTLYEYLHLVIDSSNDFDNKAVFPMVGRVVPPALGLARATVNFLKKLGVTHCGLLYDKNAFGNSFDKAFQDEAFVNSIQIVSVPINPLSKYKTESEIYELKSALKRLSRSKFRHFVGHIKYIRQVMEEAYEQGIAGPGFNWMHVAGKAVTGLPLGSPIELAMRGVSFLILRGARKDSERYANYQRLLDRYDAIGNETADYINFKWPKYPNDAEHNFTVPRATPDDFSSGGYFDHNALFVYDSIVASGIASCNASEGNDGTYFDGQEHFNAFAGSQFEGVTGTVKILPDTGSRDPDTALYLVANLITDFTRFDKRTNTTKVYHNDPQTFALEYVDGEASWVSLRPHVYSDGSETPPKSLPPAEEDMNYFSTGLRVAVLVFCGILVLFSLGVSAWTFRNRKIRVVRSSQPMFLWLIGFGTTLMALTLIPLSIDDNIASVEGCDIACMASPWLFSVGFVMTFSALFAKTWRINKLFHQPSFRRVKVTVYDVLPPFIGLLAANVIVLIVWTVVDPLTWIRTVETSDEFDRPTESYGGCSGSSLAYSITLAVINGVVLVFANFQAYRARSISTELAESHYIFLSMGAIFQSFCVGIPLMVLVEMPSPQLFVRTAIIVVVCASVLSLIFVPKIYRARNSKKPKKKKVTDRFGNATHVAPSGFSAQSTPNGFSAQSTGEGLKVFHVPKPGNDAGALERTNKQLLADKTALKEEIERLIAEMRHNKGCAHAPERDGNHAAFVAKSNHGGSNVSAGKIQEADGMSSFSNESLQGVSYKPNGEGSDVGEDQAPELQQTCDSSVESLQSAQPGG